MTTFAEQHQTELPVTEEELVSRWRLDQFHQLGFSHQTACLLAESEADLNHARSLINAGCPHSLALKIIL